jgi:voltage-gated potassium channel Kch
METLTSPTSEFGKQSKSDEKTQGWFTVSLFTPPELAKAMCDVFKIGGWPLAALFVVAFVGIAVVVGWGKVTDAAAQFISTMSILLVLSSVVTFLVLTIIAYLRWKDELNRNFEIFKVETELLDKFIIQVIQYANQVLREKMTPEGHGKEIESLTKAIGRLVMEVTKARAQLRAVSPTVTKAVTAQERTQ